MRKTASNRFLPIRLKLMSATIVSGLLAVLIAAAGLYCMHSLNQRLKEVVDVAAERVTLVNLLRQELTTVLGSERSMLLTTDSEEFDRLATTMDSNLTSIDKNVKRLRGLLSPEDELQLDGFRAALEEWKENHRLLREYSGMDTQRQARELTLGPGDASLAEFVSIMNDLINSINVSAKKEESDNQQKKSGAETDKPTEQGEDSGEQLPSQNKGGGSLDKDLKRRLHLLSELRRDALNLQLAEKNLVLQSSIAAIGKPAETIGPHRDKIAKGLISLKEELSAEEAKALQLAEQKLDVFLKNNDRIQQIVQQEGSPFGFQVARQNGLALAAESELLANQLVIHSERSLKTYERESSSLYKTFRNSLLLLSLLAVAAGVVISMYVGNGVAASVRRLREYANNIRHAKDLSRPVPTVANDEVGELAEAFDEMRVSLLRQNNRLARVNEKLAHKSEEMEQFVYSVSHDLKSPLVSCKGLVGLINEDIADGDFDEAKNSAQRLSDVTDQMSNTIDDLLTFSRLGINKLQPERVDVQALVGQLIEEWKERLQSGSVVLEVQAELPVVDGDPISLRRVFDNLIGNAVKYAGDVSDARIEIGSQQEENVLRFYVRDNGPGIEPQYHEKIFGLFQRLDTAKKGTGIGLASVSKIMRHHRGRVWVESQPDEGATFWIEFPATS